MKPGVTAMWICWWSFSRPVGLFQFIDLKQYLELVLGCPVDLGTVASLKPHLKEIVMQEAIHVA